MQVNCWSAFRLYIRLCIYVAAELVGMHSYPVSVQVDDIIYQTCVNQDSSTNGEIRYPPFFY